MQKVINNNNKKYMKTWKFNNKLDQNEYYYKIQVSVNETDDDDDNCVTCKIFWNWNV